MIDYDILKKFPQVETKQIKESAKSVRFSGV